MGSERGSEQPERYRLTVDDFVKLEEADAFDGHERRVELLDGELLWLMPRDLAHGRAAIALLSAFEAGVREAGLKADLLAPMSAHLGPHDIPEVDFIIAHEVAEPFVTPANVKLFLEVSSASLEYDLGPKLRLYARSGVPEYWVADVNGRRILRFHMPAGEDYAERSGSRSANPCRPPPSPTWSWTPAASPDRANMTRFSCARHRPAGPVRLDLPSRPRASAGRQTGRFTMLRLLAPVAALGLIASPALAATTTTKTKTTVKHHHAAKPHKKVAAKKTTTTETKSQ